PRPVLVGVRPVSTQCTKVPPGASGSSTTTASSTAPEGTPLHERGGDWLSPTQVKRSGMESPLRKAGLVTAMPDATAGGELDEGEDPQAGSQAAPSPASPDKASALTTRGLRTAGAWGVTASIGWHSAHGRRAASRSRRRTPRGGHKEDQHHGVGLLDRARVRDQARMDAGFRPRRALPAGDAGARPLHVPARRAAPAGAGQGEGPVG